MKKKALFQYITSALLATLILGSCSKIRTVTGDIISKPSAKEKYQREKEVAPDIFDLWEQQAKEGLLDSVEVSLPYTEAGKFFPRSFPVYSYELALNPGENLQVAVDTDSIATLVFLDLYKRTGDSLPDYELVTSAEFGTKAIQMEVSDPGIYKVLMQPEIEAHTSFNIEMYKEPVYFFPVAGMGNRAIQSFWGASRDAGRRSHEGVDIFAAKGTPVVATTSGRVTSTGNKGLGGKQVWLRDRERGHSLYYAHLDSITARAGSIVSIGDTLGFVGNTGNAQTTPPHLHFGIYKGYRGAINPLPFIFQSEKPDPIHFPEDTFKENRAITIRGANIRTGPSTQTTILNTLVARDTLKVLGKTTNWFHVRTDHGNSYIHESLIAPIN